MSQNPAFDSSIPVLTEVVLEPVAPAPVEAGQAEAEAAIAVAEELAEVEAPEAPAEPAEPAAAPDWDDIEARIVERVVAQLQPQLDAIVRNALASAADQIHVGLRQAVEQVVAQQVASKM